MWVLDGHRQTHILQIKIHSQATHQFQLKPATQFNYKRLLKRGDKIPQYPTYAVITATASNDNPFQLVLQDMWFKELDVFIYTNDCNVGGINNQEITVFTNDVYTIKGYINAKELYFANTNAGNNTKVVIAGTELSDDEKLKAGIK